MKQGLELRELSKDDLCQGLLKHFNRYQEVRRVLRNENGAWVIRDISFTEEWDDKLKQEIVDVDFTNCLDSGGFVWGVFNSENSLIAFACLLSNFFGSEEQYLQLTQLHVSSDYRSMGIGGALFLTAGQKAKELGAKKLYISTHSSEESQRFYERLGCVDAVEINVELAEREPYDRQMEFLV